MQAQEQVNEHASRASQALQAIDLLQAQLAAAVKGAPPLIQFGCVRATSLLPPALRTTLLQSTLRGLAFSRRAKPKHCQAGDDRPQAALWWHWCKSHIAPSPRLCLHSPPTLSLAGLSHLPPTRTPTFSPTHSPTFPAQHLQTTLPSSITQQPPKTPFPCSASLQALCPACPSRNLAWVRCRAWVGCRAMGICMHRSSSLGQHLLASGRNCHPRQRSSASPRTCCR